MRNSVIAVKLFLLGLVCLCTSVVRANTPESVVFYIVDYPPYLIESDEHGKASGMDVDVVKAAFKSSGITASVEVMPWKRIVKSMKRGVIAGTISCSKREERLSYMLFSNPISHINQVAVSTTEKAHNHVTVVRDLADYSVVGVEGWGLLNHLDANGVRYETTKNIENGITSILYRGVNFFFSGDETTKYQSKLMGVRQQLAFQYLDDLESTDLHLCVSRGYSESEDIVDAFNEGLDAIRQDGTYDLIRSNYLN